MMGRAGRSPSTITGLTDPQTVDITGSLFESNAANDSGGAIEVENGSPATVTIAGSAFEYNTRRRRWRGD